MMRTYLHIGALLAFVSCSPAANNVKSASEYHEHLAANTAQEGDFYFDPAAFKDTVEVLKVKAPYDTIKGLANIPPEKISFTKEVRIDSFWVKKYSEVLYRAQEQILYKSKGNSKVYRFTWLRSFDKPVIFKLYEQPGQVMLETKWLQDDASVAKSSVKKLPNEKMIEFEQILSNANFWNSPAVLSVGPAVDGSRWLLEARDKANYHFISRYAPGNGKHLGLRNAGEWLIAHSDASAEKIY